MPSGSQPRIQTLERHTMAALAEKEVRAKILQGELRPGDRINEVALAGELGISRGPLREAIQRLAADGLLRMVTHRGAFVPKMTEDEVRNLYELRIVLECAAIRLAAERATAKQLADLQSTLNDTGERLEGAADGSFPAGTDVHRQFVVLCGNSALDMAASDVHARIILTRARSGADPQRALSAHQEHLQILARLADRDGGGASLLMENHLTLARDIALSRMGSDA